LKADKKLFRLLTFAGLVSGTGGGCGIFLDVAVTVVVLLLVLTVERRFAVFAGSCGKAWDGDWESDLSREGASADLGAASSR
jgi:phage shock protein PspC (stress-responsive transcriptional regulator)